ncbi:ribosomal RNA small subunit methyltransferase D [mine drainage metagenome]|uniref:Ribosomal RNA small subunit methyltransferase D n=1 Tax=mine drainage metagenome TaxID=410659 RepID=A0A1J5PN33_9ZZZZ
MGDLPGLRPTPDRVRETLFNWLGQTLTGWRCLDLFAGSGALGLEAASRGAARVDLVERDRRIAAALTQACTRLHVEGVRVHALDALAFAARAADASYDLVFVDPPYADALQRTALAHAARLLDDGGLAYVEAPDAAQLADCIDPAAWAVQRSAHAGDVHYALLRRLPRVRDAAGLDLRVAQDGSPTC